MNTKAKISEQLHSHCRDFNRALDLAAEAIEAGVEHAAAAGELLRQASATMSQGEWTEWLRSDAPVRDPTTRVFMRFSELDPGERERLSELVMREAVRIIVRSYFVLAVPEISEAANKSLQENEQNLIASIVQFFQSHLPKMNRKQEQR